MNAYPFDVKQIAALAVKAGGAVMPKISRKPEYHWQEQILLKIVLIYSSGYTIFTCPYSSLFRDFFFH